MKAVLLVATCAFLCACGASVTNVTRVCVPAYSDNCLTVESYVSGDEALLEVTNTPDVSVSVESWLGGPRGTNAAGAASFDPISGNAEASGCVDLLLWEKCAEVSTKDRDTEEEAE
jgi:hypothetical protein